MIHHERPGLSFQCRVGVGHDFVARQRGEVRKESGVDKRRKSKVLQERNSEICQCLHWEMSAHRRGREGCFLIVWLNVGS